MRQKLATKANRLRRYKQSAERKESNSLFQRSEKDFYRRMRADNNINNLCVRQPPSCREIESIWRGIWENEAKHEEDATWISSEEVRTARIPTMEGVHFTIEDVTYAVNKTQNWKATGPDSIHNFWLKRLPCVHPYLAKFFTSFLQESHHIPKFITKGKTFLLPKDVNNSQDPLKYRPITCLNTPYKILTSCIADKIYKHLDQHSILDTEQKDGIKKSQGCKEQLTIDSVVTEQVYQKSRNIFTAYIDYKKAFDSVPHSWLIRVLRLYKVAPNVVEILEHLMSLWETDLYLHYDGGSIQIQGVPIRRGIFQGDSLSPLWFCFALNSLSAFLNGTGYGFLVKGANATQHKLTHILYMDDIKLYGSTER